MLKKFKMKTAVAPDLKQYIGRTVLIPGEKDPIVIEHICGNVGLSLGHEQPKPTFYEVNGQYLIGMLRFHAQMCGDKSITEEQFKAFEEMEFSCEKVKKDNSVIECKRKPKYEPN